MYMALDKKYIYIFTTRNSTTKKKKINNNYNGLGLKLLVVTF